MLASFKVSVSQVAIVPFVTAFVLSHLTKAHHIPAMASDEPTPRDNHHLSEEEEKAPSPGSPTDSQQGDPSSHAEHKAYRDNKQSHKEEVENKENQTKRKAKTKRAETLKEGSPIHLLSMSHGSTVIDCSDGSMITIYREVALSIVRYLSTLRTSITKHVSYDSDSDAEDRDSDSGSEHEEPWLCNPAFKGLGLEGVMENNLQNSSQRLQSRYKFLAQHSQRVI